MKGIGIIGCGSRAKAVLRHLLKVNNNHRVVAIYDPDENTMNDFKKIFRQNIKTYSTYQSLIQDSEIEWIIISSPNFVHKEQIIAAFNANKNVFCEKPLVISIEECKEIKKVYEQKNLNFLISYPLRYSPHYNRVKEIINAGKIGRIISLEFNETLSFAHGSFIMNDWRRFDKYSGGFLLEKCCHDIDLVNWITDSIPKKIASFGGLNFFKPENSKIFDNFKNKGIKIKFREEITSNPFATEKDIIDNQVIIIEYENGIRASFHTNLSSGIPERRMYICGEKGTIRADVLTGEIEVKFIDPDKDSFKIIDEENKGIHGGGDLFLARDLDKAITQGITPKTSMDDAIKSAITCIAIDESRKTNQIINMHPILERFGYSQTQNLFKSYHSLI